MSTDSSNLRGKCMDYALKTLDMFCYADLTVVSITPSKTSLDHLMAETGLTRDQCRRIYDIVIQTGQDIEQSKLYPNWSVPARSDNIGQIVHRPVQHIF